MRIRNLIRGVFTSLPLALLLGLPHAAGQDGIGIEIQLLEDELFREISPNPIPSSDVISEPKPPVEPPPPKSESPPPPGPDPEDEGWESMRITRVDYTGDVEFLDRVGYLQPLTARFKGKVFTEEQINVALKEVKDQLVAKGFYLARVRLADAQPEKYRITVYIDHGRVGEMRFYALDKPFDETPLEEREQVRKSYKGHFSTQQLAQRMVKVEKDTPFDFEKIHHSMFALNSIADLKIHSEMKLREELVEEDLGRQYVDLDFYVEDRRPLHASVELRNTGTERTEDFRLGLKLQHLNLTRHYDALTVVIPLSVDLATVRSFSASYTIPHSIGNGGGLSLFGGYSELDVDNVLNEVDIEGTGWFTGPRIFYRLVDSKDHLLNVAGGLLYRFVDDSVNLSSAEVSNSELEVLPLSLALTYSRPNLDRFGGRTFLTGVVNYNLGHALGITDEADIFEQQPLAEPDYWTFLLSGTRIQSIGGTAVKGEDQRLGEWFLYGNFDLLYSSDPLIAAEQKTVGGQDTVRGYPERALAGDYGISAGLELRTPIIRGFLSRYLRRKATFAERQKRPFDYMQFVGFTELAHVALHEPAEGLPKSFDLLSVGGGVRMSFGENLQLRVDYGYPLNEIDDIDTDPRVHLSAELQY